MLRLFFYNSKFYPYPLPPIINLDISLHGYNI
nr:MAG TPA: hypothetical protein [Caudoviricetes sp.]